MAEEGNVSVAIIVCGREVTPVDDFFVVNVAIGGRFTLDDDVFGLAIAEFRGGGTCIPLIALIAERSTGGNNVGQLADLHGLVIVELLAGQQFCGGPDGDRRQAREPKHIGAALFHQLRDSVVEAGDHGRDGDDGDDADDDAEDGEAGTEFIGAQGVEGHDDGFTLLLHFE